MNDTTQLNRQLAELIGFIGSKAKDADAFVLEHAPVLAREVVSWHIVDGAISLAFSLIVFVVSSAAMLWLRRHSRTPQHREDFITVMIVPPFIAAVVSAVCVVGCTRSIIQGAVAPRMVIVEYVEKKIGGLR